VEIREGTAADLDLLVRMRLAFLAERTDTPHDEVLAVLTEPTRRFFADLLPVDGVWSWFAEDGRSRGDGLCAGAVAMLVGPVAPRPTDLRTREAHVINMFVLPEHRSAGLGRRLLTAAVAAAEARGVRTAVLHATADGRPLYESLGFAPHPDWMELHLPAG
jgi:GNAT superfamily N-acetyltransferase